MPRWQATEFLDAEDIPFDPEEEPRPRRSRVRRRRRASTATIVGQFARTIVLGYAAWVYCWWLAGSGITPPHGMEWFYALARHLPPPPGF